MHKLFIFLLSCILMLNSSLVEALQIKSVKDNQTALIKISSKEQSRIFVQNDRILVVRGLDGAYELKKDDNIGDIYVQPSSYYQHKAFNLFITTEQGHSYNLLATPLEIPGETIEIKPLSPSLTLAEHWEKNSPYADTLVNLINSMVNNTNPDGYAVINLGKTKPKKLTNCLSMRLLTIYRGDHLHGEIWIIKNEAKNSTYVNPRDFYQDNSLAIALQNEALNAGDETVLYRVISDEQ